MDLKFNKILVAAQFSAAVLAVPAGAAGIYSMYHNFFSTEVACHAMRDETIATLDKNIPKEVKRSLLGKHIADFDRMCGTIEPEASAVFQAELQTLEQGTAPATFGASTHHAKSAHAASVSIVAMENAAPASPVVAAADVDVSPPSGRGWVNVETREAGKLRSVYFNGYTTGRSLPEPGAVLTATTLRGIFSEPQGAINDFAKLQGRVVAGQCVRVVSSPPRTTSGRQWVEVDPVACS